MFQKRILVIAAAVIAIAITVNVYAYFNKEITLTFYSHADQNGFIKNLITEYEAQNPRIKIKMIELPENTDEKLEILSSALSLRDGNVDIIDADVTWPSIFVASDLVEDLSPYYSESELNSYLLSSLTSTTINGKLYGAPYRVDAGMLYYRSDLLEKHGLPVPTTWNELQESANLIMAKEKGIYGYAGSMKKFEGLTCNFFEMLWSNGGQLYDNYNNLAINEQKLLATFKQLQSMRQTNMIPEKAAGFSSGDLRKSFMNGELIFMRDWPTGYKTLSAADSPVKGKFGVAPLPVENASIESKGAFGGWVYMLSSHSKNKKAAVDFIKYMTNESIQVDSASEFNYLPSLKSLYQNDEVNQQIPYLRDLQGYYEVAGSRPRKSNYDLVSYYIQNTSHAVLTGELTPEAAVKDLKSALEKLQ